MAITAVSMQVRVMQRLIDLVMVFMGRATFSPMRVPMG
jgi:hypothetical protein